MLTMEVYNGTIDPLDHLESFMSLMLLQGASDILICKFFLTTFREMVRDWYARLSLGPIYSFEEFG